VAGRPRSFDEDIVMHQIMTTFWDRGFRNTSIDDLMAVTKLSRASLYTAFGDKNGMFMRALNRYVAGDFSRAWQILESEAQEPSPAVRLAELISHWEVTLIRSEGRGCFAVQTYIEFSHLEGPIASRVQALIKDLRRTVQGTLESYLPGHPHAEYVRIADYLVATLFAMHASARARSRPAHIRNLAEINRRVISSLDRIIEL
jgi:TetR/AcrR family transcriptional regulator, transcriptional repressor for nem operon